MSEIPVGKLGEITHPEKIEKNSEADYFAFNRVFIGQSHRFQNKYLKFFYRLLIYIIRKIVKIKS